MGGSSFCSQCCALLGTVLRAKCRFDQKKKGHRCSLFCGLFCGPCFLRKLVREPVEAGVSWMIRVRLEISECIFSYRSPSIGFNARSLKNIEKRWSKLRFSKCALFGLFNMYLFSIETNVDPLYVQEKLKSRRPTASIL